MVAVVHSESLVQHEEEEEDQLNPETSLVVVPPYSKPVTKMNNHGGSLIVDVVGECDDIIMSDHKSMKENQLKIADDALSNDQKVVADGQVVIYESGKPILKVESGTTLEVVKLLYETESANQNNIIGVRPKTGGIPCIITLQDSKLEETAYDLITKDKRPSPRASPVANGIASTPEGSSNGCTTRCIECSRESWKTKRYTNVGMNTEISINPLMDGESVRAITGGGKQSSKSVSTNDAPPPKRGRPPIQRGQQPSYHPKEFVVAPIPSMPVPVSEMEFRHYRRSPRSSPVHMFGHTKIYPPSVEPRGVDLDSVPYEAVRSMHHAPPPPHHHHRSRRPSPPPPRRMMKMETERHSPPRRQRSRSPILYQNGYIKEEARDFYHPLPHHKAEESSRRRLSPRYYPYEVPPPSAVIMPAPPPIRAVERAPSPLPTRVSNDHEPTVYVLPEGFDLERDRFDPVFLTPQQQARESSKDSTPKEKQQSGEHKTSPVERRETSPAARDSPKSVSTEEARPVQPLENAPLSVSMPVVEKKLSCKICAQKFPTKSTLYKHLRGHSSDEKPFKCNECGQGFTLSSNLRQHRIIHRGYKPFQCEYCGKKFMRSNVYKQHRRIHTGEQMHKCDLCPSEFLQKYALVKHLKKVHNIETYDN